MFFQVVEILWIGRFDLDNSMRERWIRHRCYLWKWHKHKICDRCFESCRYGLFNTYEFPGQFLHLIRKTAFSRGFLVARCRRSRCLNLITAFLFFVLCYTENDTTWVLSFAYILDYMEWYERVDLSSVMLQYCISDVARILQVGYIRFHL